MHNKFIHKKSPIKYFIMGACCIQKEIKEIDGINTMSELKVHIVDSYNTINREFKQLGSYMKNSNKGREIFKV
jgi:hypothetical protein